MHYSIGSQPVVQVPLVVCKLLLVVHGGISCCQSVFEIIITHYFNTKFPMKINYEIKII